MKKRHLFIVTALVGVSLLMLAPVAYAGGWWRRHGRERRRQLRRAKRVEHEAQAGRQQPGAGVRGRLERQRAVAGTSESGRTARGSSAARA